MKKTLHTTFLSLIIATSSFGQTLDWNIGLGGASGELANVVKTDNNNNVYIAGSYNGPVDFDPSAAVFELTETTGEFLCKYDADGNFVWAKSFGTSAFSKPEIYGLHIDANNNLFITGQFSGNVDFDPGAGSNVLNSGTSGKTFLLKLDQNGEFVFAKQFVGTGSSYAFDIETDSNNDILLFGIFYANLDLDPNAGTETITSGGNSDCFLVKLDAAGDFVWGNSFGGTEYLSAGGMKITSNDDIVLTGYFGGVVEFNPNGSSIVIDASTSTNAAYLIKVGSNGITSWAKSFMGTGSQAVGVDMDIDLATGEIYASGYFNQTVDFDPEAGTSNITSNNNSYDSYISKFDATGNLIWVKTIGGINWDRLKQIALVGSELIILGEYELTVDFDPNAGIFNMTSQSNPEVYVLKLTTDGDFVSAVACPGTQGGYPKSMSIDDLDNILVFGYFTGSIDCDPSPASATITSAGITDVFLIKLTNTTSSVNAINEIELNLYPNPVKNQLTIECDNLVAVDVKNAAGKTVFMGDTKTINVSNLESGIYFITIETEIGSTTQKFIKE